MTEMVDRVARALRATELLDYTCTEADLQTLARRAIEAMREPTAPMVERNGKDLILADYDLEMFYRKEVFVAMIDTALKGNERSDPA